MIDNIIERIPADLDITKYVIYYGENKEFYDHEKNKFYSYYVKFKTGKDDALNELYHYLFMLGLSIYGRLIIDGMSVYFSKEYFIKALEKQHD